MTNAFVEELERFKAERMASLAARDTGGGDPAQLLPVALANEINVSELAAAWMPTTAELDVKLAFARQAGDEASHFQLVADRLAALGFDIAAYQPPPRNPMFEYLHGLKTTVERVAAGLFTLESIAYTVNEAFIAFCAARGDAETVRIYREYIQPDEQAHQRLGQKLLAKYADTREAQRVARDTVEKLLDLAAATRSAATARLGMSCLPGC
jgi:uncharacterized ferritin-like protein (DUF455 family)